MMNLGLINPHWWTYIYRPFEEIFDRQISLIKSHFDQQDEKLDELMGMTRGTRQRLAGLEQDARQPRLATKKVDVPTNIKTRKRAGDAAADQAKHGDTCSTKKIDPDLICLTSFGDDSTEPPALSYCRNDALLDKGAVAPKPFLSLLAEMRTLTVTSGLLPVGTVSTAMMTIFPRPLFSWSLGEETKKSNSRKNNQPAPPCWWRVIQMKSR